MVSEEQITAMMAEGGIKDDGMKVDPVSGNEIPAGSLAEEVRDDVDAKLSTGEYVVPADVVRFFGVNYFEKLREKAKAGLQKMEEDGRIGGEPASMDDLPFSDEELMFTDEEPVEMAEGGAVSSFNPEAFYPGFSFGLEGGQQIPTETRTYINAEGEVRSILFINGQPIQQIPEGFVLDTPENRAAFLESKQEATTTSEGSRDRNRTTRTQTPQDGREGPSGFSLNEEDTTALSEDPLAFGLNSISKDEPFSARRLGGVGGAVAGLPGLIVGGLAGAGMELENVARARAALKVAESRGLAEDPRYAELVRELERAEGDLSGAARLIDSATSFGSGDNYAKSIGPAPEIAPMTPQAIPTGIVQAPEKTGSPGTVNMDEETGRERKREKRDKVGSSTSSVLSPSSDITTYGSTKNDKIEIQTSSLSDPAGGSISSKDEEDDPRARAQRAADKLGQPLATGPRAARGGLVSRPKKKTTTKK